MTKKLMGLFTAVALMGSGVAFANDQTKKQESQQSQSQGAMGGSGQEGQEGQTGQQMGQMGQVGANQLTGRVVKSDKKTVWIEHAGAIVPLKIDKNTQFTDPNLKKPQDLKEGDEIRASFEVRKTDNVATSIEKSSGVGGSGTMVPDSSINEPSKLPSDEGAGGSGKDLGTGSDVDQGANQNDTSGDY